MEEGKNQYLSLLSEIIAKEAIILGPTIVILKSQNIPGLKIDNNVNITEINGDAVGIVQKLVDGFVELTGEIAKKDIEPIFEKYPTIRGMINF